MGEARLTGLLCGLDHGDGPANPAGRWLFSCCGGFLRGAAGESGALADPPGAHAATLLMSNRHQGSPLQRSRREKPMGG